MKTTPKRKTPMKHAKMGKNVLTQLDRTSQTLTTKVKSVRNPKEVKSSIPKRRKSSPKKKTKTKNYQFKNQKIIEC